MEVEQNKKLNHAWNCVLDQYFDLAYHTAMEEGKGISIFRFLKKTSEEGCNCHYFYSKADGSTWNTIMETSPQGKYISENYDHNSMILICVQIPYGDSLIDDETNGNMKLFYIDTKKEVASKEEYEEKKNEGLRKRNVKG